MGGTMIKGSICYVERITVSKIETREGTGKENDPIRRIIYWYDDDGLRIARIDMLDVEGGKAER